MARVLIGWELGGNRGHLARIAPVAAMLRAAGHEVALALQHVDALGPDRDTRMILFQAPLWPGLIFPTPLTAPVSTLTDILCRVGLDRPGVLAAMVSAWDAILAGWRPDIVIAEFAPALLCAARGRVRLVTSGTGFVQPPSTLAVMPRLNGPPGHDEVMLLDTIDADLRSVGRAPLPALPALFAADHHLIEAFRETDPYRESRSDDLCVPRLAADLPATGGGDEIFAYGFAQSEGADRLWNALAMTNRPCRACIPDASPMMIEQCARAGIVVHTRPVPWSDIVRRSRIVVSHGGQGMICSALIAGVPHVVVYHDLEKRLNGEAVAALGLGVALARYRIDVAALAAALAAAYDDAALASRAAAAAPGFAGRRGLTFRERVTALIPG